MENQPTKSSAIDDILKALNQPRLTPEQVKAKKEARLKYNRALNGIFSTEYGQPPSGRKAFPAEPRRLDLYPETAYSLPMGEAG